MSAKGLAHTITATMLGTALKQDMGITRMALENCPNIQDFIRKIVDAAGGEAPLLNTCEQKAILENPRGLMLLMDYHDFQQDQADSMGAECHGNRDRKLELREMGRKIMLQDMELHDEETKREFFTASEMVPMPKVQL